MATEIGIGPNASTLIAGQKVHGTDVYNVEGHHLGHIHDIMIDKMSGRVVYAIMAFGGVLGIGERYHALPWSVLSYEPHRGGYVIPYGRDVLKSGPTLSPRELTGDDRLWRDPVHTHYGIPPYWR
jgi:sporulation protein YlmC with PRC-barrel domain